MTQISAPWHHIHTSCKACSGTDRKHYSGGLCTRCYTQKAKAEGRAWAQPKDGGTSKRERLERRILRLEVELLQAQAELENLGQVTAEASSEVA